MNEKLSKILMDGIADMHKIMEDIEKPNFDVEKAKMKIATNNSLTTTAKTLIQLELLKVATKTSQNMLKEQNKKVLEMQDVHH